MDHATPPQSKKTVRRPFSAAMRREQRKAGEHQAADEDADQKEKRGEEKSVKGCRKFFAVETSPL